MNWRNVIYSDNYVQNISVGIFYIIKTSNPQPLIQFTFGLWQINSFGHFAGQVFSDGKSVFVTNPNFCF